MKRIKFLSLLVAMVCLCSVSSTMAAVSLPYSSNFAKSTGYWDGEGDDVWSEAIGTKNGQSNHWQPYNNGGVCAYINYQNKGTGVQDAYLFSPKFEFKNGKSYLIKFNHKGVYGDRRDLAVFVGTSKNVSDYENIDDALVKLENLRMTVYQSTGDIRFTPEADGEYHVVIYSYTGNYQDQIYLNGFSVQEDENYGSGGEEEPQEETYEVVSLPYTSDYSDFSQRWKSEIGKLNPNTTMWSAGSIYPGPTSVARINYNPMGSGSLDAYLFSPHFAFEQGKRYIINFRYITAKATNEKMAVYVGKTYETDEYVLANALKNYNPMNTTTFTDSGDLLFTPEEDGDYMVVFYAYSDEYMDGIRLTDFSVKVDESYSGGEDPGPGSDPDDEEAIDVPYTVSFANADAANPSFVEEGWKLYSTSNANANPWTMTATGLKTGYTSGASHDFWAVSPKMHLEAGKYTISLNVRAEDPYGEAATELINLTLTSARPNADSPVKVTFDIPKKNNDRVTLENDVYVFDDVLNAVVEVETTGDYYVGVYDKTPNANGVYQWDSFWYKEFGIEAGENITPEFTGSAVCHTWAGSYDQNVISLGNPTFPYRDSNVDFVFALNVSGDISVADNYSGELPSLKLGDKEIALPDPVVSTDKVVWTLPTKNLLALGTYVLTLPDGYFVMNGNPIAGSSASITTEVFNNTYFVPTIEVSQDFSKVSLKYGAEYNEVMESDPFVFTVKIGDNDPISYDFNSDLTFDLPAAEFGEEYTFTLGKGSVVASIATVTAYYTYYKYYTNNDLIFTVANTYREGDFVKSVTADDSFFYGNKNAKLQIELNVADVELNPELTGAWLRLVDEIGVQICNGIAPSETARFNKTGNVITLNVGEMTHTGEVDVMIPEGFFKDAYGNLSKQFMATVVIGDGVKGDVASDKVSTQVVDGKLVLTIEGVDVQKPGSTFKIMQGDTEVVTHSPIDVSWYDQVSTVDGNVVWTSNIVLEGGNYNAVVEANSLYWVAEGNDYYTYNNEISVPFVVRGIPIVDGILYELDDDNGTCTVIANNYNNTTYVLPEQIEFEGKTYTVTAIGENAFLERIAPKYIVIPATVTSIGANAFKSTRINDVMFCEGIGDVDIASNAFAYTYYLENVYIDSKTTTIDLSVFGSDAKVHFQVGSSMTGSNVAYANMISGSEESEVLVDGYKYVCFPENGCDDMAVTYTRDFTGFEGKWQALYVPFAVDATAVNGRVAELSRVYTENGARYVEWKVVDGILEPGVPYLYKPTEDGVHAFKGTGVVHHSNVGTASKECDDFGITLTGVYEAQPVTVGDNNYYLYSDGNFHPAGVDSQLKPFRCFLTIDNPVQNASAPLYNVLNNGTDTPTAIGEIPFEVLESGKYYDLQGREVKNPTPGVYIVNGRKVVIK